MAETRIDVEGGKYTVVVNDEPHSMTFIRYGELWEAANRDYLGSKFIYCMAMELHEARQKEVKASDNELMELRHELTLKNQTITEMQATLEAWEMALKPRDDIGYKIVRPEDKATRADHVAAIRDEGFIILKKGSIVRQIVKSGINTRPIWGCRICGAAWPADGIIESNLAEFHYVGCALPQGRAATQI